MTRIQTSVPKATTLAIDVPTDAIVKMTIVLLDDMITISGGKYRLIPTVSGQSKTETVNDKKVNVTITHFNHKYISEVLVRDLHNTLIQYHQVTDDMQVNPHLIKHLITRIQQDQLFQRAVRNAPATNEEQLVLENIIEFDEDHASVDEQSQIEADLIIAKLLNNLK